MISDRDNVRAVIFNKHGIGHITRVERFPEPGETVRALEWQFGEDGGKGTNVAVALALLGVQDALVCKVGMDESGRLGEKWLKDAGVDCSHYLMSPDVCTYVGVVIARADGENMVIGSPKHECFTTREELFAAIDAFAAAKYFISGFEIDQRLPLEGCKYAKQRGKITMLNPSPLIERVTERLDYVDYLFINAVEGVQLTGCSQTQADHRSVAAQVKEQYQPRVVVMTLGSDGCILCEEEGVRHFPPYEVKCIDSVAAGDGFMAAFTAGIEWGMTNAEAADWANRYSAVVVSRRGAILSYPSLEEVKKISSGLQRRRINGGA